MFHFPFFNFPFSKQNTFFVIKDTGGLMFFLLSLRFLFVPKLGLVFEPLPYDHFQTVASPNPCLTQKWIWPDRGWELSVWAHIEHVKSSIWNLIFLNVWAWLGLVLKVLWMIFDFMLTQQIANIWDNCSEMIVQGSAIKNWRFWKMSKLMMIW